MSIDLSTSILPYPLGLAEDFVENLPDDLMGNVILDESGKLLKQYIEYKNFAGFITDSYDAWLTNTLPKQIQEFKYLGIDGSLFAFEFNRYESPKYYSVDKNPGPLLPQICRLNELTYNLTIYVDYTQTFPNDPNRPKQYIRDQEFGKIPLCLKSRYCNLYNKTDRELLALGECNNDPGGYFIINGSERIILSQDKLASNKIITFLYLKNTVSFVNSQITFYTFRGPKKIQVIIGKFKQLELHLPFLGTEASKYININIYSAFRLLGINDLDKITSIILIFIDPKLRRKASNYLEISKVDAAGIANDLKYIAALKNKQRENDIEARLLEYFFAELFPVVQYPDVEYGNFVKAIMLAQMCNRCLNYLCGASQLDDRDNWANKKVEVPSKAMELLATALMYQISEANMKGNRSNIAMKAASINSLEGFKSIMNDHNKKFENTFEKSFASSNWGIQGGNNKENITDSLKRDSVAAVYSQLTQVNAPAANIGSSQARLVHPSQLGYICPSQTPEGTRSGLVKNFSITAFPTIDRPDTEIITWLENTRYENKNEENKGNEYSNSNRYPEFISAVGNGNLVVPIAIKINDVYEINRVPGYPDLCTINGIPRGWCNKNIVFKFVKSLKLTNIAAFTSVIMRNEGVEIYTTGSRVTRPLLTVNPITLNLVKDEIAINGVALNDPEFISSQNKVGEYINTLMANGALEYIDADEQDAYVVIAQTKSNLESLRNEILKAEAEYRLIDPSDNEKIETLNLFIQKLRAKTYTHCEIDPQAAMGIVASLAPASDHEPGARVAFNCNMGKQSLGIYHNNYMSRFDTTAKVLAFPSRPMFETQINQLLQNVNGQTVTVMLGSYTGYNIEDGFVFKQSSIDAGLFWSLKYMTIKDKEDGGRTIGIPDLKDPEKMKKYSHLHSNGLPVIGSYVEFGQILIAKKIKEKGIEKDASRRVGIGENGKISRVYIGKSNGINIIKVKIEQIRKPQVGDKFAARYAQKGTIGKILPDEDMPFVESGPNAGLKPDVIISPFSISSRMTIGYLIEIMASKVGALKGERVNASSFRKFDPFSLAQTLRDYGYNSNGNERMINGITGKRIEAEIFIGPAYFQNLGKDVIDKIQSRGIAGIDAATHEPIRGRTAQGGSSLRFGEMESSAGISHNAPNVNRDRLNFSSDGSKYIYCTNCGIPAIHNVVENKVFCKGCRSNTLNDFGTHTTPTSFKYLLQTLGGVNIKIPLGLRRK
jgi:DNA-directed RNA polymerase II subunit RPB2